ncbi:MAG: LacI family DNA-binding transcriptional regulator [Opitutales bacterium]|nr:LacI family DNA-binding transcriptional regulator [Opitutales bacterium]
MSISIKDVAKRAGCAVSTVSLALRNSQRLKAATRERICQIAEEMGYQRNPAFAALGSHSNRKRGETVSLPVAWIYQSSSGIRQAPWAKTIEGAKLAGQKLGYEIDVYRLDEFSSPAQVHRMLYARGVVGVVIEYFEDPELILAVDWSPFSVVACGAYSEKLPFDSVRASNFTAARTVFSKVWGMGYRRIGVVSMHHEPAFYDDWSRVGGALACEIELRGELGGISPLACSYTEFERIFQWIENNRPDVIIGFPAWLYDRLIDAGYRIPRDFAYADMAIDEFGNSDIAGTLPLDDAMGVAAMEMLDASVRMGIRGVVSATRDRIVGCKWRDGKTLPVPR